ncbi:MAG TPA: hypothetical protein VEL07_19265 [Planctomycetota bacterium]|nr:hypothetical protein [Planctomycetota bacterium]
MADNVAVTPGAGAVIATDDVAGIQYQLIKLMLGGDGVAAFAPGDTTNGLDVDVTRLPSAMTASGSAAALNADCIAATDCLGYRYACVQIAGTFVATFTFQGSNDNTNWFSVQAHNLSLANNVPGATGTGTGLYAIPLSFRYLRVRATAYTSGTMSATALIDVIPAPSMQIGGAVALVSAAVGLNTGSNTIGAVQLTPAAAHGASSHHHRIAQATNVVLVKASPGTINSLTIANLHATNALYFKLYNSASAPTLGAGTPIEVFRVPAGQTLSVDCGGYGIRCTGGIAYALTSDLADTGVTNVAANDALVGMSYT